MYFLEQPTRNLFFTGKGGVGKTSLACAAAVRLADRGLRVLLVSTDPASNLDQVLGTSLGNQPTPVDSAANLCGMNIDPEAAAREYRERMVGPYRNVLPEAALKSMEEQFSGSCTLEIAAFDEFSHLLGNPDATEDFDHVIFDTAPTGHTLRLLTLPSAWSGFMENNTTGTSCLGPLAGLQAQQRIYQQSVRALSDPHTTTLVLVTRPESSALKEAARTSSELKELGIHNQHLVINGVFTNTTPTDPIAKALEARGILAMESVPAEINELDRTTVPLAGMPLLGVEALRQFGTQPQISASIPTLVEFDQSLPDGLDLLIDDLATTGHGVILAMGKGGVGKTTIASAIAVALAERGLPVHLSTTDPAAHLATTLATEGVPGLTVGRIDPARETADYTAEVMQTAGADLDAEGKSLLEEDLRSPCTEEIAVFRALAKAVSQASDRFVVLDTAPTGHTILLLDSALAYHREVSRQANHMPDSVRELLPRLRDPSFTRVLIVTLPEATPVHEAAQLQQDLRRAEIEPYAWVINQSFVPLDVVDPLLQQRRNQEFQFIDNIQSSLASRATLIPWQCESPTGLTALRRMLAPVIQSTS
jgi:arsenite-transporting ATPase